MKPKEILVRGPEDNVFFKAFSNNHKHGKMKWINLLCSELNKQRCLIIVLMGIGKELYSLVYDIKLLPALILLLCRVNNVRHYFRLFILPTN